MVTVRVLTAAELPLVTAAFPEPRSPVNRHAERFALQESGDVTCLVAWDEERPVGWVFARWPGRNGGLTEQAIALGCVEFGDLFVAEGARGRGTGRALMEAVEALVRQYGIDFVGFEVTVANAYNEVARGLYERMGYQDAGFAPFVSGHTYWDERGQPHRDEELHRYLTKRL